MHMESGWSGAARARLAAGLAAFLLLALLGVSGLPAQVAFADEGLAAGVALLTTAPADDGAALAERMGMTLDVVDPEMVEAKQLSPDCGLYVSAVESGGPASVAGIRVGDVLTHADGAFIVNMDDLDYVLEGKSAGDSVALRLERGHDILLVQVTFDDGTAEDMDGRGYRVRDWRSSPVNGGIYGGGAGVAQRVLVGEDSGGGGASGDDAADGDANGASGAADVAGGGEAVAGAVDADGSRVAVADSGGSRAGDGGSGDAGRSVAGGDAAGSEAGANVGVVVAVVVACCVGAGVVGGAVLVRRRGRDA